MRLFVLALICVLGCDAIHSARFDVSKPPRSIEEAFLRIASDNGFACEPERTPTSSPQNSAHFDHATSKVYWCRSGDSVVATAHLGRAGTVAVVELFAGAGPIEPESLSAFRAAISEGLILEFGEPAVRVTSVDWR
jgi:hypothetical protein